jgi:hypothetical protein
MRALSRALFWGLCIGLGAAADVHAETRVEVSHSPVVERIAEQGILTPVPIRIRFPPEIRPARVLVHLKAFGAKDWSTLELQRSAAAWQGEIPCLEVSTITGILRYYIRAYDEEGSVIATSGSRAKPYQVLIKKTGASGLAGSAAPRKCPDPTDCPRGLPGCGSEPVERVPCRRDTDCEGGLLCSFDGFCERAERDKNWLSLAAEQDFVFVPTTDACTRKSQTTDGYACFRQRDGAQYRGSALRDVNHPIQAGLGPTRVVVGYDRLILEHVMLGGRAGWAVRGEQPAGKNAIEFLRLHAEVRLSYWLGHDPLAHAGLRGFLMTNAGVGQFDTVVPVQVGEDLRQAKRQGGNDLRQTLDASKRAGDFFLGAGAGLLFGSSRSSGFSAALRVLEVFPFGATVVAPELGYMKGF